MAQVNHENGHSWITRGTGQDELFTGETWMPVVGRAGSRKTQEVTNDETDQQQANVCKESSQPHTSHGARQSSARGLVWSTIS